MTKELQTIQRQVIEQAASLPKTDVFGQQARGLFAIGQMGAMAAEQLAVEGAGVKGIEAASAEQGSPRKLAPGVTKATRAYNEAYLNTQTSLLANSNESQKLDAMRQLQMRGIKPNSVGEMSAIFGAIDEGTLKGANPEIRAALAIKLNQSSLSNLNKVANAVTARDIEVIRQNTERTFDNDFQKYKEAILTGENMDNALLDVERSLDSWATLNNVTPAEKAEKQDQIDEASQIYPLVADARKALANGTIDIWTDRFARDKSIPESIKYKAWNLISSERQMFNSQTEGRIAIDKSMAKRMADEGTLTNEDMRSLKNKLPLGDYIEIQNYAAKQIEKQRKKVNAAIELNRAVTNGDVGVISKATNEQKNDVFAIRGETLRQEIAANTNNPDYQLTPFDEVAVASELPFGVPDFQKKVAEIARIGSEESVAQYAMAFASSADDKNKYAMFDGMDAKARSFYLAAGDMIANTDGDKQLIIDDARKNAYYKDDKENTFRQQRLKEFYSKESGGAFVESSFKTATGGGDPTMSVNAKFYAFYNEAFNNAYARTLNKELAAKEAAIATRSYSTSRFAQKGQVVRGSIEQEYQSSDISFYLDNVLTIYEQKELIPAVNEEYRRKGYGPNIQLREGQRPIADDITDAQMLTTNLYLTGGQRVLDRIGIIADVPHPLRGYVRGEYITSGHVTKTVYEFSHVNQETGDMVFKVGYVGPSGQTQFYETDTNELGYRTVEIPPLSKALPRQYDLLYTQGGPGQRKLADTVFDRINEPYDFREQDYMQSGIDQLMKAKAIKRNKQEFFELSQYASEEEMFDVIKQVNMPGAKVELIGRDFINLLKERKAKDNG